MSSNNLAKLNQAWKGGIEKEVFRQRIQPRIFDEDLNKNIGYISFDWTAGIPKSCSLLSLGDE